jgi:hypothetical protein
VSDMLGWHTGVAALALPEVDPVGGSIVIPGG